MDLGIKNGIGEEQRTKRQYGSATGATRTSVITVNTTTSTNITAVNTVTTMPLSQLCNCVTTLNIITTTFKVKL